MTVSVTARAAMYAEETGEVFLILLTIDHANFTNPIRVVNNTEDVVSNGDTYVAYPFDLVLPDSDEDREIVARLMIDNIDRSIVQEIRQIDDPPTADISVIRAAEPDTLELSLPTFTMRNVIWDALTISADLLLRDITTEPYPQYTFDPGRFAGLF